MKTALSGGAIRLLSDLSAYFCIVLLMDIGNQYAGVVSFSGQSEMTWLMSCTLLAVFSAITLACHADRLPNRNPVEDTVALRVNPNAASKTTGK